MLADRILLQYMSVSYVTCNYMMLYDVLSCRKLLYRIVAYQSILWSCMVYHIEVYYRYVIVWHLYRSAVDVLCHSRLYHIMLDYVSHNIHMVCDST